MKGRFTNQYGLYIKYAKRKDVSCTIYLSVESTIVVVVVLNECTVLLIDLLCFHIFKI